MEDKLAAYVEDVALYYEQQGLPRIGGRILGLLLICDPPHRSARQLAEELCVSKASISSMTRLLLTSGSIEAVALPGDRATYYQLTTDGLEQRFERRLSGIVAFHLLAERGLALLEGEPLERSARLRRIASLYAFLADEIPRLLERWREQVHV